MYVKKFRLGENPISLLTMAQLQNKFPMRNCTFLANAAPEWQARRQGWHSRQLVVACPLKGLVGWPTAKTHIVLTSILHNNSSQRRIFFLESIRN